MPFLSDKQTLADLNLLGKYNPHSVFSLFNKVRTDGGERLLEELFRQPLTEAGAINDRSGIFRYFQGKRYTLSLNRDLFVQMENYLGSDAGASYPAVLAGTLRKKLLASLFRDESYQQLQDGLRATITILNVLYDLVEQLEDGEEGMPYASGRKVLATFLANSRLSWLRGERDAVDLPAARIARYDYLFRHVLRDEIELFLKEVYHLDVYLAVSDAGRAGGLSYAWALPADRHQFHASALRHPALPAGVGNPLSLDRDHNMLFLTGANMAGKSTLMKAFGIAVYLAHMGFPVAATDMRFSVLDGLYSSINVPDDLQQGYSHFYAEVLRVKTVAQEVSQGRNLVVLFDELFKGTNVKDAYDATLSVTEALAAYRNCLFVISTHIIEVGHALTDRCDNLQFSYLPTILEGNTPRYTYRLTEGITNDRQGMMIIGNERILEMLEEG